MVKPTPARPRKATQTPTTSLRSEADATPVQDGPLDTRYLETLLGYNARRAALAVIAVFLQRMERYDLRPVDFSVLTLIAHNPGVTSRQICTALDILPPNLVGIVKSLQTRGWIVRRPHPTDRRAQGLHLTEAGRELQSQAQTTATELEDDAASPLTARELDTLKTLLRKVYQSPGNTA